MANDLDFQVPTVSRITPKGELAALDTGAQYGISTLKYPEEVGTSNVPHYLVFNIYVPDDKYTVKNYKTTSANSRSQNNMDYLKNQKLQTAASTQVGIGTVATIAATKNLFETKSPISAIGTFGGAEAAGQGINQVAKNISFRPKIKQIAQSIAIYMPDTVMTTFKHDYNAISATEALGDLGLASAIGGSITSSITNEFKRVPDKGMFKRVSDALGAGASSSGGTEFLGNLSQLSGAVGNGFTDLALKSAGVSVNPQVELLYKGTANRTFVFEFRFQPRSAQESETIRQIIQTFKKFSSPSIQPGQRGRYFIVPGQFDITFKFQNTTNKYLSQISTCVLSDVDINYSGAGQWASFNDGAPVEIALQLRFTEGEIITRELMNDDNNGF